ncbi:hypothetical protein DAI22_06g281700 [Oryza sativa Japonica Group]|nr:hypothetical protein DAI22_06g281700 [Oryza sativa Japonica Group]
MRKRLSSLKAFVPCRSYPSWLELASLYSSGSLMFKCFQKKEPPFCLSVGSFALLFFFRLLAVLVNMYIVLHKKKGNPFCSYCNII